MPRWQPPNTVLSQQHFSLQNGSPGRDIGRTCGTSLEPRVQTKLGFALPAMIISRRYRSYAFTLHCPVLRDRPCNKLATLTASMYRSEPLAFSKSFPKLRLIIPLAEAVSAASGSLAEGHVRKLLHYQVFVMGPRTWARIARESPFLRMPASHESCSQE